MKQNWQIKKVGEVCEVIAGQSPEGKYYNNELKGLPFYQGKKEFGEKYIGEPTTWTTQITKEAEANDILMSVRAPVGPINFSTQKICIGRGLAAIRASKLIDKEFLFYFLLKHENEIVGNAGAVFDSINKSQIEAIEIPVPPLSEQKRIASILDSAFATIDRAKANSEQNLQNARELFESYLQSVFENNGEGWEEKTLGEVIDLVSGQHIDSKEYNFKGKGIGYLTGPSDFGVIHPVVSKWTEFPKQSAIKNDILITVKGSGVGKINLMSESELCISRQLMAIRAKTVNVSFLYAFLSTKYYYFQSLSNGAAIPGITRVNVQSLKIKIPPIRHQQVIVQKINAFSSETKKLEDIYQAKINDLEELKRSLLKKAFSGELN
ncbi:MAG TPA: restriction endonuclease subunit S [Saprospiraceae bacterium]|nr:restriction endonuclease subunit S [Saprospiraceae bacterium]HNT20557.1 restriction endonuclease subunit S [Saprospiraceae bacterium]